MRTLLAIGLLTFVLAGCSAGTSTNTTGTLTFSGSGSGSQDTTKNCDSTTTFSSGAVGGSGSVTVTIRDGNGVQKHAQTFTGPSAAGGGQPMTGAAGDWKMTASRADNFAGSYSFTLSC